MRRYDRAGERRSGASGGPPRRVSGRAPEEAGPAGVELPSTSAIGPEAVARLQRAAGNAGVAAFLGGPEAARPDDVLAEAGRPLDPDLRQQMESSFQADFSTVRVHDGGVATTSARALGARAYTVGEEIVVGEGGSDPQTMAHELAHVVQQRAGEVDGRPTSAGFSLSDPGDRFERAAEATAEAVATGTGGREAVPAAVAGPAASAQRIALEADEAGTVQRAPAISDDELPDIGAAASSVSTVEPPVTTGGGPSQVVPVEVVGDVDPGSLAAQAGVIRDDLQNAIDALSGDPPDYKGAVTAMRDGGEESTELRDKVRSDPAAHDLATFVMDTFYIVGKDIWPKAGLGGKSSDVTDAIQLEKARVDAVELAERLKGGPGGRSR